MKYDTIRILTSLEECPERSTSIVEYGLEINDQKFHPEFSVDISDLAKSCQSSGELYLLTCGCGVPECAGIFQGIEVGHTSDAIRWACPEPLSIKDDSSEVFNRRIAMFRHFSFEPEQYIEAIDIGIKNIKSLAVLAKLPVEFPVHGVRLEDVLMLEARIFSTHTQEPGRQLMAQLIIVNGYHGLVTVDGVNYSVRELYLSEELLTKYEEWTALCVFPGRESEIPLYLSYLQSGREFCRALRRYLGQQTVVKFSYHPSPVYNRMAWEVTEIIR